MSDPIFVAIAKHLGDRIEAISKTSGYHLDLGQSVQIEGLGPVQLDDQGQPLPGHVVIDPGAASSSIGEGDDDRNVRIRVTPREAIYERSSRVIVSVPISASQVDDWLIIAERVGEDLRKAIYANEGAWMDLYVTRIGQTEMEAQRPAPGAKVLLVAVTFTIRYHSS